MRLFIAVALPPPVRQELASLAVRLSRAVPGLRPVGADAMHVTVRFLGEVPEVAASRLRETLRASELEAGCFGAVVGGFGRFPPRGLPRVLYAGVRSGGAAFVGLWEEIRDLTRGVGEEEHEERFVPHLTLARVKGPGAEPGGPAFSSVAREIDALSLPVRVESVGLYESVLARGGPRYTLLEEVRCAP